MLRLPRVANSTEASTEGSSGDDEGSCEDDEVTREAWACDRCTFLNPHSTLVCEMCKSPQTVLGDAEVASSVHENARVAPPSVSPPGFREGSTEGARPTARHPKLLALEEQIQAHRQLLEPNSSGNGWSQGRRATNSLRQALQKLERERDDTEAQLEWDECYDYREGESVDVWLQRQGAKQGKIPARCRHFMRGHCHHDGSVGGQCKFLHIPARPTVRAAGVIAVASHAATRTDTTTEEISSEIEIIHTEMPNIETGRSDESTSTMVESEEIPATYMCPIQLEPMKDPVLTCDGMTYERVAIEEWLETHDTRPSPVLCWTTRASFPTSRCGHASRICSEMDTQAPPPRARDYRPAPAACNKPTPPEKK